MNFNMKMPTLVSLIMAVVPSLLLVWYYCRQSDGPVRSKGLIIAVFLMGIFSVIPICGLEYLIGELKVYLEWSPLMLNFFKAFIVAGVCEEYIKMAIVRVFVYRHKQFQRIFDGIIFTIIAGLGFACIENVMYVVNNRWATALARGFTTVPMHAVCSGILGYYIGESKFARNPAEEQRIINTGLWQAIILHGLFNFLILISPLFGSLYAAFVFPLIIGIYIHLKKKIKSAIAKDSLSNEDSILLKES